MNTNPAPAEYTLEMRAEDQARAQIIQRQHVKHLLYHVQNNRIPCPQAKDGHHDVQTQPLGRACTLCGLNAKHCLEEWP